ncbi:ribbon-helix-helix domain-containing protein [Labrys miyagiensis]|uniref:ribbon-helix-helix domain-containing protein n=1 Tax=Labrys miyagiensis TaxID=346912 RepID=UPI0024E0D550|nr:ribbon-helix-helix domain-containing protein [Labrys miyagiensis]
MNKPSEMPALSITLNGRKSSISLEDAFWQARKDISNTRGIGRRELMDLLDRTHEHQPLTFVVVASGMRRAWRRRCDRSG